MSDQNRDEETTEEQDRQDSELPQGRLLPPTDELAEIQNALAEGDYDKAIERAEETTTQNPLQADWRDYLRGLIELGRGELDSAFGIFERTWKEIASAPDEDVDDQRRRLAAKCLKKMGWYHRRTEEVEQAYAYHSMEEQLADRHGSPTEHHDAALSLDVDAYHLGLPQMSRHWLEVSIEAAEQIDDEIGRHMALGMSWNNLAGTLCDVEAFAEAGDAADASVEHWSTYEELAGPEENRLVWAKHIVGDAYKRWGDYLALEGDTEGGRERLERAESALEEAVEMAEEREMDEDDREDIRGKLDAVRESIEEIEGEDEEEREEKSGGNATAEGAEDAEKGGGEDVSDEDEGDSD